MISRCGVGVVGAGPQGLTAAVYLVHAGVAPSEISVVDPSGRWLAAWESNFARLGIAHLRSPSVHHPHPDPYALGAHAASLGRDDELVHRYGLPTTGLFADFSRHLIDEAGLADVIVKDEAVGVTADGELALASGNRLAADHVVWATNPSVPAWPAPQHADAVGWDHVEVGSARGTVAVVGGGLTGAHLVERALDTGWQVEWVTRRTVEEREFDTDPGWLGPKEMRSFAAVADPRQRLELVTAARGGGTVPGWMMTRLRRAENTGRLCRHVGHVDIDIDGSGGARLEVGGTPLDVEVVWMATGARPCVSAAPPLERLCRSLGCGVVEGRPLLDDTLRVPGSVVHVMGGLAQLSLGPTAGNLAGARRGAELVVSTVAGIDAMYVVAGI